MKSEVAECGIRLNWTGQVRYGGTEVIGVSIRGLSWREKKAITFNCLIPITSYISSRELKE